MDQPVAYCGSSESKIIIHEQLNANGDHIPAMDKSLTVTKMRSCHVAAIESLNLHKSGSNRGSYDHSNGCLTIVAQKLDEQSPSEVFAVDKSLTLASSADSSADSADSGIAPSSISNGKSDGIVDQLSTSKRSDSHDKSKDLINETWYLDAVSELDSSGTSYGESSYVVNQSSTPKRSGANSNSHGKSSEANQADDGLDREQNVAVVDFEHAILSPAHSETDIIISSLRHLFVEEQLTAGSDDNSYDSNSDEWISENESSDENESDTVNELTIGHLNDSSYSDDDDYDDDSMSGYEDMYDDDYENFELNDSIRAAILQHEIETNSRGYKYTSGSSATTDKKCPICLAPFLDQDDVRSLPCFHLFHTECVDEWFKHSSLLCPNCKVNIKSASEYLRTNSSASEI